MLYRKFFEEKKFSIIFLLFILTRYFFHVISGYDHYQLQPDSYWYSEQSDEVLKGNFNLERLLFITAPFFSYFQAIVKFIGGGYWEEILFILQLLISSISGVYFYRLSILIFKNQNIGLLSTVMFCFYPFTLWWAGTFTQDIWFQSFLIIFLFYFILFLQSQKKSVLIKSAIIFSVTYLTKSHILLFALFIPLIIIFYKKGDYNTKLKNIIIFTSICFFFTLPYGLYNLKVNNTYVISSTGHGGLFLLGHNDDAYINHIKTPDRDSEEARRLKDVKYKIIDDLNYKIKKTKDHKSKQLIYMTAGLNWVKQNPDKNRELIIYNIKRFFTPGLHKSWYTLEYWLFSLVISFPIYILGYFAILKNFIQNPREHFWIVFLIISLFIFSVGFYFQGRFRTITLEPFYILYSGFTLHGLILKFLNKLNFQKFSM